MQKIIENIAEISNTIRYIAVYKEGNLTSWQRENISDSSAADSDKYEELLVNPTILTIAKQRGDIDCGGLDFVVIKYGHFYQLIQIIEQGHLSICIDAEADPLILEKKIKRVIENHKA